MTLSWVRWVAVGTLFLIPFTPLYVADWSYFPFIAGKGFLFRILVEVATAAWIVLAFADRRYRPQFSWTFVAFGLLAAWMFVADLFGANPHKAFWSNYERMDGWVTLAHVFLLFSVAGSVLSVEKLWRKWWLAFLSASALVSLYAVGQLLGLFVINQGGVRVDATFGNAAYLAAYLLFALFISFYQAALSKGWLRHALIALAALHAIVLFYTATRGAILAALAAGGLASLWWAYGAGKRGRIAAAALFGLLVLVVGGFFLARSTPFVQEEPTLARFAALSLQDAAPRVTIWGVAWDGFLERPVAGWGQEGFNYVFNARYDPAMYEQEQWFDRAHNVYLDWLIAGGAPALLLFVALLGGGALALMRRASSRPERVFLVSALAAYAAQALFVFDNLFTYVPLAMILAVAHAASTRPLSRLEQLPEASPQTATTVLLPAVLVVLIVAVWLVNVPGMRGSAELIRALQTGDVPAGIERMEAALQTGTFATQELREQLVNYAANAIAHPDVKTVDKEAIYALAATEMLKEIERAPNDARLYLHLASLFATAGDMERARDAIRSAEERSPRKQSLIMQRGVFELRAGNRTEALAAFREAYELDTSFDDVAAYVAAGEMLVGNHAVARALLMEHFGTTAVNHRMLLVAYEEAGWQKELDELSR